MMCDVCEDLCVRFPIRSPSDLKKAVEVIGQNIGGGAIVELSSSLSDARISELFADTPKQDYVEYHFRCSACDELFWLHAETYHGSGGYWEPKDQAMVRKIFEVRAETG